MPSAGFESEVVTSERLQTHALVHADTGIFGSFQMGLLHLTRKTFHTPLDSVVNSLEYYWDLCVNNHGHGDGGKRISCLTGIM